MNCFKCDKTLEGVFNDDTKQPYAGTSFTSYGQYGSTVFDPMDDSSLTIYVCDPCLIKNSSRVTFTEHEKVLVETKSQTWEPPYQTIEEYDKEMSKYE